MARWLGIHPNGGSYGTNLGYLRSNGYLDGFMLAEKARELAEEPATGVQGAMAAISEPQRKIISTLLSHREGLSKAELAMNLNLHPNGGSFGTNLGWLRTMGLITPRGPIAVTPELLV